MNSAPDQEWWEVVITSTPIYLQALELPALRRLGQHDPDGATKVARAIEVTYAPIDLVPYRGAA